MYKLAAAIITTIFTWASAMVAIRIGLESFHPGSMALLRFLTASVCMLFLWLPLRKRQQVNWRDAGQLALLGFVGFTLYNLALNTGEVSIPAGIAGFIIGLIPVLIVLAAVVFLGESFSTRQWFGLIISLAGLSIIAIGEIEGARFDWGILYTLGAAVCGAYYAVKQKVLLTKFHPIEVTTYAIWAGTIFLLIFTRSLYIDLQHAKLAPTLATIYMGIFPAALGYQCWSYVLSRIPASQAGMYLYSLPIVTTFLAWLIIGEFPAWVSLLGGGISLLGTVVMRF